MVQKLNAFQSDLSTNIKTNFEQMKFNSDATGMAESSGTSIRSMTENSRLLVDAAWKSASIAWKNT